jgi:large subunit ribosomal protein L24
MTAVKLKIKKGDEVVVITGRDKGKTGEVVAVDRETMRVTVRGINMVKRHQRPTAQAQGGIIEKELGIHISNVALRDPKTKKATKVGTKVLGDGRKVRVARKSGETLDK